ncbi:MAG: hypothetical protein OSB41_15200, partial [Kiritimatiellae bacterium]|nr:hypothetical protein [Kiritimatiellia bacterium]
PLSSQVQVLHPSPADLALPGVQAGGAHSMVVQSQAPAALHAQVLQPSPAAVESPGEQEQVFCVHNHCPAASQLQA